MDSWPSELQQKLKTNGFEKSLGSTTVTTDMDTGVAKVRSRYTDAVDTYSCEINLDFDEVQIFEYFYKITLRNGSLTFLFDDPFTEQPTVFRFNPRSAPSIRPLGGRVFTLSMSWEKMP